MTTPNLSTVKISDGPFRSSRCDNDGNICVTQPSAGLPFQFFLTANGDGTGAVNLNGNYTSPTDFWYEATARYEIYSLLISISDNANFNQTDYGAITAGLTNGVKLLIRLEDDITEIPILNTGAFPVKTNAQWLSLTADTSLTSFAGLAQSLTVNFDLIDHYGKPFTVTTGQKIIVRLNDNFSGLTNHTFGLRGILYT